MAQLGIFEEYVDTKRRLSYIEEVIGVMCRKWVDLNADKLLDVGIDRVEYWSWSYTTIKGDCSIVKIEYYVYRGNVAIPQTINVSVEEILNCSKL